jgi:hypothetical protein
MILAEALLGAQNGQGISYSRRKVFYSIGKRYRAPAHTYVTVVESVDELAQQGWLRGHRVIPNNRGWQSSFCATPELIAAARDLSADPISSFQPVDRHQVNLTHRMIPSRAPGYSHLAARL